MPYREEVFEEDRPFHILSHAVENIFNNEATRCRFIFQLYAANIGRPVSNLCRTDIVKAAHDLLKGNTAVVSKLVVEEHPPLVHILDFSLIVNHYHLYLVSNIENGILIYIQRLNMAFAKYFNLKYKRNTPLFKDRYKSILVKTEKQSFVLTRYINVINPLDVYQPGWRKNGLEDRSKAFEFLKTYQFSSFPDKIGERRSKLLAPKDVLEIYLPGQVGREIDYIQFVNDFLEERLVNFQNLFLE